MSSHPTPAVELGLFDGHEVIVTSVRITNAGDGLSSSMAIEPEAMHIGDKKYIAVALMKDPRGGEVLPKLIAQFDDLVCHQESSSASTPGLALD